MEDKSIFTPFSNGAPKQGQQSDARDNDEEKESRITATNKRKEIQFKASHTLLIGFFLWILYVEIV